MNTVEVKNLSHLKKLLHIGAVFKTVSHAYHPDYVGLLRVVTAVQTNGVYSKIKDQPNHFCSNCNHGKGLFTDFEKASRYIFGKVVKVLDKDGNVMYEFEVLADE